MWSPTNSIPVPLSPSTSSSNQSSSSDPSTPTRTLRRKRSSANAALTTRPSSNNLSSSLTMSPNSNSSSNQNLGGISIINNPSLSINLQTLVLVHTTTSPKGKTSLAHALFEPDFLIDSNGKINRLSRENWERVRDVVEGLRIVGRRSNSNSNGLLTPDQSPDLNPNPNPNSYSNSNFNSKRWFSLAPENTPENSRSTSTLLIQPTTTNTTDTSSCSKVSELLTFQVYGVGDSGAEICPNSWSNLPNQLKNLLIEAERLSEISNSSNNSIGNDSMNVDDFLDSEDSSSSSSFEGDVRNRILNLLENQ